MKLVTKTLSAIVAFGILTAGQAVAKVPDNDINNPSFLSADKISESIDLDKLFKTPRFNNYPLTNIDTPKSTDQVKLAPNAKPRES